LGGILDVFDTLVGQLHQTNISRHALLLLSFELYG
jgi:hypothetical protein